MLGEKSMKIFFNKLNNFPKRAVQCKAEVTDSFWFEFKMFKIFRFKVLFEIWNVSNIF